MIAALLAASLAVEPPRVAVHFDRALGALHGRLIVMLSQQPAKGEIEPSYLRPHDVEVAGVEVVAPAGATIEVPVDAEAYPRALRDVRAGRYTARAELDVQHRYTYDGGRPGDPDSGNVVVSLAAGRTTTIAVHGRRAAPHRPSIAAPEGARWEHVPSASLSRFFGRPIFIDAYVVPPPGYAASTARAATEYVVGGYGISHDVIPFFAARRSAEVARNGGTSLVSVYLDPHVPLGHSVFADSANNGPWGKALTTELIPYLEAHWRLKGSAGSRFLTGHSSGGWTTMWLQVAYPDVFGGTWSTSPDPLDFHDFTGPDLVDDPAGNMFADRAGKPYPFVRIKGRDIMLLRDYILQERALGTYGGQFGSFDAVFSPRGDDGRPQTLFDRVSGQIDPSVARAWEQHYDIVRIVRERWPQIGASLRGKIHVWVGTWDTFHLEGPVHRLQSTLAALPGSDASITFVPQRDHFDLYRGPNGGLTITIVREMEAAAARDTAP